MILLIDNYDSFSYNLYQLIGEIDSDIKVIRNDEMTVEEIEKLEPDNNIAGTGQTGGCGNNSRSGKNRMQKNPDAWRMPRTSGDMQSIRSRNNICEKAYARKTVDNKCG